MEHVYHLFRALIFKLGFINTPIAPYFAGNREFMLNAEFVTLDFVTFAYASGSVTWNMF